MYLTLPARSVNYISAKGQGHYTVGNKLDMSIRLLKKCQGNDALENLLVDVAKMKEYSKNDMRGSLAYLAFSLFHLSVFWFTLFSVYEFSHQCKFLHVEKKIQMPLN